MTQQDWWAGEPGFQQLSGKAVLKERNLVVKMRRRAERKATKATNRLLKRVAKADAKIAKKKGGKVETAVAAAVG